MQLNAAKFAGHMDWRIPTVGLDGGTTKLETILDNSVSGCGNGTTPCVPAAFDTGCTPGCSVTGCSCTATAVTRLGTQWPSDSWSATTYAILPTYGAWLVDFGYFSNGSVNVDTKGWFHGVRAVR